MVCTGFQVFYCTPGKAYGGVFSPFPHGTCGTLSVIEEYLGREGGPP